MKRWSLAVAVAAATVVLPISAEESVSPELLQRIRAEASERSAIMPTIHMLTDVYGPRLTGSPNLKAAGEWAVKTLEQWGLVNGRLEPWSFGRPGWVNERVSAHIVSPVKDQLISEVVAWTPGTNGPVRTRAFQLLPPDRPTEGQLTAYLESVKGQVKGRIVLAGKAQVVPVDFEPAPMRRDGERLRTQYDPDGPRPSSRPRAGATNDGMTPGQVSRRIDEFLIGSGALLRVNDAGREHGQIAAYDTRSYPNNSLPALVLRNEDYGRIARLLADGVPVELEIDISNRMYPDGSTAYNAVAELPGGDKKNEVVMLGAHLDSWHAATGATDNAVGCAVMMEAVRILKAIGAQPRRTIRVALWSGEEQGLLGSRAYVQDHFGSFEEPKPAHQLLTAYLNLDNGTGRVRGATVFGPRSAAAVLRQAFAPLADLGVVGAASSEGRSLGATDSTAFSAAGLPGVNFQLDPIQYESHTHHTNLDTYERVIEEDVRASAIIVAATAYALAMRDEPLPRFDRSNMPELRR